MCSKTQFLRFFHELRIIPFLNEIGGTKCVRFCVEILYEIYDFHFVSVTSTNLARMPYHLEVLKASLKVIFRYLK